MIHEDHCVHIKRLKDMFVILSLYIDDILISATDIDFAKEINEFLSFSVEMKDMCDSTYILGVNISRDRSKRLLSLSQELYFKKVLERFNMKNCKCIKVKV